ncbi:MAG: flavodoxin family protein [Methermicoccaceae archaeon]
MQSGERFVLGICASPRKRATHYVLEHALSYLRERGYATELFHVMGKKLNFCIHCDNCIRTGGTCVFEDDLPQLYEMMERADGIIMATPVYNGGCSAQLKAILDRTRAPLARDVNMFSGKVGMAIAVGGDRVGGQELAMQQIITFYIINGIVPVGGGAFGANLGATFWSKDTLDGVMEDEYGLKTLRKTLKRFIATIENEEYI